ncbi:MAG: universal stress protein [Paracoccaceae bacterium]
MADLKRLLVPIRSDGKSSDVLAHAALLATRFTAHIEAVHCRARPEDMLPYAVAVPQALRQRIQQEAERLANTDETLLRETYEETMGRYGIAVVAQGAPVPRDRASARWFEEEGRQMDVIRRHGRIADLSVVAKPDRDQNLGFNTLRAALYQTGRPVLLCPDAEPAGPLGRHVAIAWNGSLEATRALSLGGALIAAAERVTILDGGAEDPAMGGQVLAETLALKGISADRREIAAGRDPGAVILAEARASGADLLVMGAYSHSREYETIFGGATQHVVEETAIPVLMAH